MAEFEIEENLEKKLKECGCAADLSDLIDKIESLQDILETIRRKALKEKNNLNITV